LCQAYCDLFRGWIPEETLCDPQNCQVAHNYWEVHPIQSIEDSYPGCKMAGA